MYRLANGQLVYVQKAPRLRLTEWHTSGISSAGAIPLIVARRPVHHGSAVGHPSSCLRVDRCRFGGRAADRARPRAGPLSRSAHASAPRQRKPCAAVGRCRGRGAAAFAPAGRVRLAPNRVHAPGRVHRAGGTRSALHRRAHAGSDSGAPARAARPGPRARRRAGPARHVRAPGSEDRRDGRGDRGAWRDGRRGRGGGHRRRELPGTRRDARERPARAVQLHLAQPICVGDRDRAAGGDPRSDRDAHRHPAAHRRGPVRFRTG